MAPSGQSRVREITRGKPWAKLFWPLRATDWAASGRWTGAKHVQSLKICLRCRLWSFEAEKINGVSRSFVRSKGSGQALWRPVGSEEEALVLSRRGPSRRTGAVSARRTRKWTVRENHPGHPFWLPGYRCQGRSPVGFRE